MSVWRGLPRNPTALRTSRSGYSTQSGACSEPLLKLRPPFPTKQPPIRPPQITTQASISILPGSFNRWEPLPEPRALNRRLSFNKAAGGCSREKASRLRRNPARSGCWPALLPLQAWPHTAKDLFFPNETLRLRTGTQFLFRRRSQSSSAAATAGFCFAASDSR